MPGPASDLAGIQCLSNLTSLDMWADEETEMPNLTDLSPISGLSKLEYLGLIGFRLVDVSELGGLVNLRELNLNRNQVEDLGPLAESHRFEDARPVHKPNRRYRTVG